MIAEVIFGVRAAKRFYMKLLKLIAGARENGGGVVRPDIDTSDVVFLGQLEIATERPEAMLAEIETWRKGSVQRGTAE
jgi:hypothetical protein